MSSKTLSKIVSHLDRYLRIADIGDAPNALNGLQIENSGRVTRVGAAVDGCEFTIRAAGERGIDLLVVHHGLTWGGNRPFRGALYRTLKLAIDNDIAVYSAHLPLDLHPDLGNNPLLAKAIGMKNAKPFWQENGQPIGLKAKMPIAREALAEKVEEAVGGPVRLWAGGPAKCGTVGVVTGGAGSGIARCADEGVDTFITGEGPHWSALMAEELGVNLLLAGHYATETFGVKALAQHIGKRFKLPWEFIDHPTGL